MSMLTILDTLLIGPLKLVFEIIFAVTCRFVDNYGLAIVFLSLTMNILVLPLYRRADAMQEEARDMEAKLREVETHIKKTFSGDERMMILQTYHRQMGYKPTDALRGSVSLLLEIPFFMAAYQFLSNVEILEGVSLGPIADLGAPDGILEIAGMTINLLPILMTLINFISSALYLKGYPLKTKIQLYGMALFFLVFLYDSPACLVFYWTLNNVFSLVKTIFYKLKNPKKVLRILTAGTGLFVLIFGLCIYDANSIKKRLLFAGIGIVLLLPMLLPILKSRIHFQEKQIQPQPSKKLFLMGALFLTVLTGILIPSTYIAASPQEYVNVAYFQHPLWYLVSSGCLAAGTFLVWMGVFYWLADARGKTVFDRLVWILCGAMLINYMFFGTDLGTISSTLQYDNDLSFSAKEQIVNVGVLCAAGAVLYLFAVKWKRATGTILLTATIAMVSMSALNLVTIKESVAQISVQSEDQSAEMPSFQLSKTGKNVVVLMLDRALGVYTPYIFNEKPELKEQFDGFTYFANTISHGGVTNFGVPGLAGGYEYTPVEMNRRDSEPLVSKHNEALKLMPTIFSQNGYQVTVCDPSYANYQWLPDLSIYDDIPGIHAFRLQDYFNNGEHVKQSIQNNHRNFFCFSMMKSVPLCLQVTIYAGGTYNQIATFGQGAGRSEQIILNPSEAEGMNAGSVSTYNALHNLPNLTDIVDANTNTYLFMVNEITHSPMLLQTPDYVPAEKVDNTQFDAEHTDRFTYNGITLNMELERQMAHYQVNMAAMIQVGKWLDYLRENDVYDNTRIILVSDHGYQLFQSEKFILRDAVDIERYFPLLMVKDFNSKGFQTSHEFMTNADVPTLALKDLVENPINPFTGKPINSDEKYLHDQYITESHDWDVMTNNGNTFLPSKWLRVKDNIWEKSNWELLEEETVLSEYPAQ